MQQSMSLLRKVWNFPGSSRLQHARHVVRFMSTSPASHGVRPQDLSARKIKQRLGLTQINLEEGDGVCAAYCLGYPVLLSQVASAFQGAAFSTKSKESPITYRAEALHIFSGDVLHFRLRAANGAKNHQGHAFFFRSGAAVFWGLPLDSRRTLLYELSKYQEYEWIGVSPLLRRDVKESRFPLKMEDFDHEFAFTVDPNRKQPTFHNDKIYLHDFTDPKTLLAFSYGLAQSVKLLIYEEEIDSLVLRTRSLPDELARDGKIKLSHRELKGLIGELLAARYSVNLVSDILDIPEYFWQHAELENLHMECTRETELRQRARILDTRTQVIKDALDILNNELSSSSSDRVERAILFLIAVEVSFEVARLASLLHQS